MCQSVRTHFISIHRSRNCNRSVRSMYDRVAQSDKSREGRHQVGTNKLYRRLDVCCDNVFCDGPLDFPRSLHQQSRVSWWRSCASWTSRIHVASKMDYYRDHFGCWVSGEPVASRWSLGKSHARLSNPGAQPQLLLQLSRCYHIYGMSYWAVALPFMMYLASWGTCLSSPQAKCGTHCLQLSQPRASDLSMRILNKPAPKSSSTKIGAMHTIQSHSRLTCCSHS